MKSTMMLNALLIFTALIFFFQLSVYSQYHYQTSRGGSIGYSSQGSCPGPWYYEYTDSKGIKTEHGPYKTEAIANERKQSDIAEGHMLNKFWGWKPGDPGYFTDNYSPVYCRPDVNSSLNSSYENEKNSLIKNTILLTDGWIINAQRLLDLCKGYNNLGEPVHVFIGGVFVSYSNVFEYIQAKANEAKRLTRDISIVNLDQINDQIERIKTDVRESFEEANRIVNRMNEDKPRRSDNTPNQPHNKEANNVEQKPNNNVGTGDKNNTNTNDIKHDDNYYRELNKIKEKEKEIDKKLNKENIDQTTSIISGGINNTKLRDQQEKRDRKINATQDSIERTKSKYKVKTPRYIDY